MRRILVIGSHPDDEVLGVGGTIVRHTKYFGDEVHVMILTDGCSSQYHDSPSVSDLISRKRREALEANRILGVSDVEFCELPDMKLDTIAHVEINRIIEQKIADFKPEIVYTHHFADINMDHRQVNESTCVAVRPIKGQSVKEILMYVPVVNDYWNVMPPHFTPNYFVDITNTMKTKLAAMKCYETELRDFPHPRSLDGIVAKDRFIGTVVGCEYAEAFQLMRKVV